jgi:hypothetical protein
MEKKFTEIDAKAEVLITVTARAGGQMAPAKSSKALAAAVGTAGRQRGAKASAAAVPATGASAYLKRAGAAVPALAGADGFDDEEQD